ncbi:twin-arginine translocation signal domain-containing protein [Niabella sp. W65]|nr:twin-arginine translocation signal domain-containing protein [Niabella sp. W65]MCH7365198.1 twin-arginine translocation signal domain-containing protein [Niabella sp. W65]ULT41010.1 twin-arginine translocation signal domain-containing protein [Niabella sp. I65]
MDTNHQPNPMKRRDFLQKTAVLAASAIFLPALGNKAYSATNTIKNKSAIPTVKLNNGLLMPMLGFGTYSLKGDICQRSVADAISLGYRLLIRPPGTETKHLLVQESNKAASKEKTFYHLKSLG